MGIGSDTVPTWETSLRNVSDDEDVEHLTLDSPPFRQAASREMEPLNLGITTSPEVQLPIGCGNYSIRGLWSGLGLCPTKTCAFRPR
jgi:hypothetical protein